MYEYDEELEYEDWSLMPETKAILYNIFKQYLATEEQRKYLQQKERQEENNKLIVKRDLSFKKILAKLKSIFRFIKGL